jgi:tripartite-type tricarboxylate transporter receptor subunit TctC
MVAPAKTPQTLIDRLQTETIAAVKDPDLKEKVSQAALDLSPVYGMEFQELVINQLNAFRALGKAENISVD